MKENIFETDEIIIKNDNDDLLEKNSLISLISNCMGIFYSLKQNGRINLKDNKFAKILLDDTFNQHSQEFYEINSALFNF